MHLRRALLLFAIVLGLAAVAAALSTPPQQRRAEPRRADRPPPRIGSRSRRRPESNRCTRLCRPLRSHSATAPKRAPRLAPFVAWAVAIIRQVRGCSSVG